MFRSLGRYLRRIYGKDWVKTLYDDELSHSMENKKRKRNIGNYDRLLVVIEKFREVVRRVTLETWWDWSGGQL